MRTTRIFVERLDLEASIGVLEEEAGRLQPLVVDIVMVIDSRAAEKGRLETTADYRNAAGHARRIVAGGHIRLVEDFAEELAEACLGEEHVVEVTIRAAKPGAIAGARAAGVEITRSKG